MDPEIKKILKPIVLLAILLLVSSIMLYGLALYEGRDVTFLRCVYMVTITISTIGYEDMMDMKSSPLLMIFNIVAIFCYMILVAYCISNFTAFMVEGRFRRYFQQRRFLKRIRKMENHYIICGIKDVGVFAAQELAQTQRPFVVIDDDVSALEKLRNEIPDLITVTGDSTEKSVLENAGIKKARALIACLETDKDNVYLILEASELNPNLELAAKYDAPHTMSKLQKAGAKFMVCPSRIGGMRIASELIRPRVVSFLDLMLRDKTEEGIRVEQVKVAEHSSWVGKPLGQLYQQTKVLTIGCQQPSRNDYMYNPDPQTMIEAHMILIFIASPEKRKLLEDQLA